MKKLVILCVLTASLSACASGGVIPPSRTQGRAPAPYNPPSRPTLDLRGLEAVMGKDRAMLTRLFGPPRIDVVEPYGRKLQFSGPACVLDAYLYPDGKNGAEIVTHVDARRSDGAEVDRASCVNALQRR